MKAGGGASEGVDRFAPYCLVGVAFTLEGDADVSEANWQTPVAVNSAIA